jgi:hypothetical protein
MQYILLALVYFGHYYLHERLSIIGGDLDVAESCEHKGVRMYGKFDYYLICP